MTAPSGVFIHQPSCEPLEIWIRAELAYKAEMFCNLSGEPPIRKEALLLCVQVTDTLRLDRWIPKLAHDIHPGNTIRRCELIRIKTQQLDDVIVQNISLSSRDNFRAPPWSSW